MKRRLLKYLLFSGSALAATFLLLEVAVRVVGYAESEIYDPVYLPFNDDIPYVHKPNLMQARARGRAILNTDSLGLRSRTPGLRYGPKQANEYRIAIVGDSVTFGEGVPNADDTYAAVLETALNERQAAFRVKVFNYGVSAYSVKTMAATLRDRMLDIEPDLVLMAIIPDDFYLERTPTVDGAGYLRGGRAARTDSLAPPLRWLVRRVHLAYVIRNVVYRWWVTPPDLIASLERRVLPDSYVYLRQFKETADAKGVPSLIVLLPRLRAQVLDGVAAQLASDRIQFVDLSGVVKEFTPEQYRAGRFEVHPSAAVHKRIGQALAAHIVKSWN